MGFTKKEETPAIDPSTLSAPAPAATEKPIPVPANVLNPETQAYINSSMAEALKDLMAQLAEAKAALANNSFTPEALANAFAAAEKARREPDQAVKDREKREKAKTKKDLDDARKLLEQTQSACDHRYVNGSGSLAAIRNRPDRQILLLCLLCHAQINPREWVIDAPEPITGAERSHIRDAHPQYTTLLREWAKSHQQ